MTLQLMDKLKLPPPFGPQKRPARVKTKIQGRQSKRRKKEATDDDLSTDESELESDSEVGTRKICQHMALQSTASATDDRRTAGCDITGTKGAHLESCASLSASSASPNKKARSNSGQACICSEFFSDNHHNDSSLQP